MPCGFLKEVCLMRGFTMGFLGRVFSSCLALLLITSLYPRIASAMSECPTEFAWGEPASTQATFCDDWHFQNELAAQLGLDTSQISATFNFAGDLEDSALSAGLAACGRTVKLTPVISNGHKLEMADSALQAFHAVGLGTISGPSGSVDVQYHAVSATVGGTRITAVKVFGLANTALMTLAQTASAGNTAALGILLAFVDPINPRHNACIGRALDDAAFAIKARALFLTACLAAAGAAFLAAIIVCQGMALIPLLWLKAAACAALIWVGYKVALAFCATLVVISATELINIASESYKRCLAGR